MSPEPLTLPAELANIPWRDPWVAVVPGSFGARLAEEAGPKHVLYRRPAIAVGRRVDNDDVLYYLPAGPALLAVVHLTYSTRTPEPDPRFPWTTLYASVREWTDKGLDPDAEEAKGS